MILYGIENERKFKTTGSQKTGKHKALLIYY